MPCCRAGAELGQAHCIHCCLWLGRAAHTEAKQQPGEGQGLWLCPVRSQPHLPPSNVWGHGARLGLTGSGSTKCLGSADPHTSRLQRGLASPSHHVCPPPQHCAMPRGHPCTEQVPSAGPDPGGPSQEDLQVLAVTRCHRGAAFWALLRCPGLLCAGREAVLRPFPQPQGAGESQPRSQHPAGSPAAHLHPLPSERMHPANIHKRHLRGCHRWVVLGGRRCWRLAKGYLGVEGEGPC